MVMTVHHIPPDYALWVFIGGEVCDALDGPCARHWHYPNDGKKRWWRRYNKEIDQISDILLAIACAAYLIFSNDNIMATIGIVLTLSVAALAWLVHDIVYGSGSQFIYTHPSWTKNLLLARRYYYVFAGVGGAIATLIWCTSWSIFYKAVTSVLGVAIAIALIFIKRNRLHDIDTPL